MCSPRNITGTPTETMEKKAMVTRSPANMLAQRRMVNESTRARWLTISMGNIKIDKGNTNEQRHAGIGRPQEMCGVVPQSLFGGFPGRCSR